MRRLSITVPPELTRPDTSPPRAVAALSASCRTEITSRRGGRSMAASSSRIWRRLASEARMNILLFMPESVPPGSTKGRNCGSTCSAVRLFRSMISSCC